MSFLEGKKTYIVVLAMIAFAASGLFLGRLDGQEAVKLILEALAILGLRDAIAKK
jgi:hypothetical protein